MPDTPEERLQRLVIEASVTGSSQGVLSADLRRRIDAAVEDIKRAHIDALTAAVDMSHAWTPCTVCGSMPDDPEAAEPCEEPHDA